MIPTPRTHRSVHHFTRTHHHADASETIASTRAPSRSIRTDATTHRRTVWSTPRPPPHLARGRHPRRRIDDARARSRRRNSSPTSTRGRLRTSSPTSSPASTTRTTRDATETPPSANAHRSMHNLSRCGIFGSPRGRRTRVVHAHIPDQSPAHRKTRMGATIPLICIYPPQYPLYILYTKVLHIFTIHARYAWCDIKSITHIYIYTRLHLSNTYIAPTPSTSDRIPRDSIAGFDDGARVRVRVRWAFDGLQYARDAILAHAPSTTDVRERPRFRHHRRPSRARRAKGEHHHAWCRV